MKEEYKAPAIEIAMFGRENCVTESAASTDTYVFTKGNEFTVKSSGTWDSSWESGLGE